jgi:hypothetical protein
MIPWPDHLIDDIARRKVVLFLGAGISMNSKGAKGKCPKSWAQLLTDAADKLTPQSKKIVLRLLKERDYLTACEIAKAELKKERYETFLTTEFLDPKFQPAPVHDILFKLDSRIVATPNIDKIYETRANHLANGSVKVKHYYDDDIADAIRRPHRVVLKVHGTIDKPASMIFTRREYAQARVEYSEFYAIVDALAITHTFLFLGCGVNDPDIRLMLENYAFKFRHTRPHYITVPQGSLSSQETTALQDSTSLECLPYSPSKGHKELIDSLDALQQSVETRRSELASSLDW